MTIAIMSDKERIRRFWSKVVKSRRCWEWKGGHNGDGYGYFHFEGRNQGVHRIVLKLTRGPIPDGLTVDHLCRNRGCVNPSHLDLVPIGENIRRGMCPCAKNWRKTHCLRGHPLSGENLSLRKSGGRTCKACMEIFQARYHKRKIAGMVA